MELVKDTDPVLRQSSVEFDFNGDVDPEKLSTHARQVACDEEFSTKWVKY